MNFRGGNSFGGGRIESDPNSANDMSFEEAMEAARFADLGGLITAEDYETSSVGYNTYNHSVLKCYVPYQGAR